jgi:hypothetical protein
MRMVIKKGERYKNVQMEDKEDKIYWWFLITDFGTDGTRVWELPSLRKVF